MDWDLIILLIYKIFEFLTTTYLKTFNLLFTYLKNIFLFALFYTINLFSTWFWFVWEEFIHYYFYGQEELLYEFLRPIYNAYFKLIYNYFWDLYLHLNSLKPFILYTCEISNLLLKETIMYFKITPISQLVPDFFEFYWHFGNDIANHFDRADNDWELNFYMQIINHIISTWIAFQHFFREILRKDKMWNAQICYESCIVIIRDIGLVNILAFCAWAYLVEFGEPKLAYDWIWLNTPPPKRY